MMMMLRPKLRLFQLPQQPLSLIRPSIALHPTVAFLHTFIIMNAAQAQAILAETMSKVKHLEAEIETLTGKDNKKARSARSRVIAEMKKDVNFMDAERILAGKEAL